MATSKIQHSPCAKTLWTGNGVTGTFDEPIDNYDFLIIEAVALNAGEHVFTPVFKSQYNSKFALAQVASGNTYSYAVCTLGSTSFSLTQTPSSGWGAMYVREIRGYRL